MKLNCIIVDDEPLALDILEEYINRTPTLSLAGRFSGSAEALKYIGENRVDLALLDIQMPGLNGLDMAKLIGGDTRVIFTTAFPQYAIEGFRVDALDYLLKPISFAEFTRAVEKAVAWFSIKQTAVSADREVPPATPASPSPSPRTLIVKSDYKQFVIPIDKIVYIEGIRDYIRIHTEDGAVQTLMNMKTVETMLPGNRFARVHRSWIVNLDRVKRIERAHIILEDPTLTAPVSIPVSETYKESFLHTLSARSLR
jgi:DNA-binding LytR/AlgR family response regulator